MYIGGDHGPARFRWVKAPTHSELTQLTCTIAQRVGRYLERQGLLVRDADNSYLTAEGLDADDEVPLHHLLGSSITYRIAIGPQQGRKVFTLQTLRDCGDDPLASTVGKVAGFSLHAGVAARAHEREKLERLCRYIARPAVSTKRLSPISACGGEVRIISCIEDPAVIRKILAHLDDHVSSVATALPPRCRAPPRAELLEGI